MPSRRNFLKQIGVVASLLVLICSAYPFSSFHNDEKDFEMLVVGDSLITGQGLNEKDKLYNLTKEWLARDFFKGARKVNLKNKSHSGSRLFLAEDEIKALNDAEREADEFHHPEVNISFPSSKTQIDVAAKEYLAEGKNPADINLILVSGGLTNLNSSYIINPFKKTKPLKEKIDEYCNHMMLRFLNHAAETFPNALIAVVGYFPMISKKSSTGKIYNTFLELYEFPRPTKPLMNNILTKQFFKPIHNKLAKRSQIWFEDSNKALKTAVDRMNKKHGVQKAIFVKSPITEDRSFSTKNSLLFGMAKKGRSEDPMFDIRMRVCGKTFESLKDVKLKFKRRICELAGIGHPNVVGSKAYADAINQNLRKALGKTASPSR